jgi:hypothetical protein
MSRYCNDAHLKTIGAAFLSMLSVLSPSSASGADKLILCVSSKANDVVISIGSDEVFGQSVSCIAGDFAVDITPCAPDGAYALSAPTGSAAIVEIVDRWQDYGDHIGGVTSHFVSDDEIYFEGGFMGPESGYSESWHFSTSRLTGRGELWVADVETSYECSLAKQLF